MGIEYSFVKEISPEDVANVFRNSGIRRPYNDLNRIKKMIDNADIIITAWDNKKLVGIARALTDYSYCCYLSDLAVDKDYQKSGIGKHLIELLRNIIGEEVALILISAPEAMDYYPKIGFEKCERAFIINRKR
jgi:ribosomal protein S18 acetylase RimI-like enzyme